MVALFATIAPLRAGLILTWLGGAGTFENDLLWDKDRLPDLEDTIYIDNNLLSILGIPIVSVVSVNSDAKIGNLFISSGDTLNVTNGNSITFHAKDKVGEIENNGLLKLSSSGNSTEIKFKDGVFTLSGSGSLVMSNNINNRITGNQANDGLINAVGHTIEGAGQIGLNILTITNQGTIVANQSNTLTLDPDSNGFINTGTLRATNGATLVLLGNGDGSFANTGGLIEAQDGSSINLNGATVIGGNLTSAGTGRVYLLANSTISGLSITSGSNVEVSNAQRANLVGTVQNSGTLKLASGGSTTDLVVSANATLSGSGSVTLTNTSANRIIGAAATDVLTQQAGHTIQGSGQVGAGLMGLNNAGTIIANQSTPLTIDPSSSTTVVNTGTLRATNGATLALQNGTFTNTGGTIEVLAGSFADLSAAAVTGGNLTTFGTGLIRSAGSSTFTNVTVTSGSTLQLNNATATTLIGSLTLQGAVMGNSGGNITDLVIDSAGVTLSGGGVISFSNTPANRLIGASSGATLTNTNVTIRGSGQIGASSDPLNLINHATIEANQSNPLTITPGAGGVTNDGTLRAIGGATLTLQNGTFTNFTLGKPPVTGLIQAQDGSFVDIANATIAGGSLATAGSGLIRGIGAVTLSNLTLGTGSIYQVNNATVTTLVGTFNNLGTLQIASGGNITDLLIDTGGVTLSGGGLLTLSNTTANRLLGTTAAATLTNVDNTIRGSGQIGADKLQLFNQAVIEANQSNPLTIDPNTNGVTNTGTLRATSGATLVLQGGTFTNTGGIIQAQNGSFVDLTNATITDGQFTTAGTGTIRSLGSVTLSGLALVTSGNFEAVNATVTTIVGTFTNNGLFKLNSGGNTTDLLISGDVTLSGSGSVSLSDTTANRILGSSTAGTDTLFNQSTIVGAGQLGADHLTLVNSGVIIATLSNPLIIDPGVGGVTNTNILRANAGTLRLQSGLVTNTGGTIEAVNGSVVEFTSGVTIAGGLLNSAGTGRLRNTGTASFSSVNFSSSAIFDAQNGTTTTFAGTINNLGLLNLASGGNTTDFLIASAGATFSGGGTIALTNTSANRIVGQTTATTLVNLDNVIRGSGQLGANALQFDNRALGIVEATQSQPLTISTSGAGVTNTGTLRANGGTLVLSGGGGGAFNNVGGTIAAIAAGSHVEFSGASIAGGTLSSVAGASLQNTSASTFANLTLAGGSLLQILNATSATMKGSIQNSGTIALNSGGNLTDLVIDASGVTLTGGGFITMTNTGANRIVGTGLLNNVNNTIQGSGQLGNNELKLTNTGTIQANQSTPLTVNLSNAAVFTNQGTLHATNGATLAFTDALTNAGAVKVDASSTFSSGGTFTQSAGSTSLHAGTFSASSSTFQGGMLQGNGTINGAVTNSGSIAPGAADSGTGIGTLTFGGNLTLTSTSALLLELGGTSSFDKISAPNISLGGALTVSFTNGFQTAILPTNSFALLSTTNATGLTGTFAGLSDGSRFSTIDGFSFQINYQANGVVISNFSAIPEPSTYAMIAMGAGMICFGWRRRRSKS